MRRSEVDFIANQDYWDVDTELTEIWEPIGWYSREGMGIVDSIYNTDHMSLTGLRVEMGAVVRLAFSGLWNADASTKWKRI
jgi:hypothetical protein